MLRIIQIRTIVFTLLIVLSNLSSANNNSTQRALSAGYTQEEIDAYLLQRQNNVVERWECKDFVKPQEILALALVKKGRDKGIIEVAGVTYESIFSNEGFERRWDFPVESLNYAFIIKPNGTASYYDFRGEYNFRGESQKVKASIFMICEQKKS